MSELMLHAVLQMPIECWGDGEIDKQQRQSRYVEASHRIEELERENEKLRDAIRKTLVENGHLADGEICTLIRLKRALGIEQCKKCGADMQDGVAMGQTFTGMPDFSDGVVCTVSPGGSGKIIECKKCPECGWSVTK